MTTENKTTTKSKTTNQAVFAPLGKYAVIGVIMVTVIVTTAIMLDKQLNSVERNIAAIENEVAALSINDDTITTVTTTDTQETPAVVAVAEVEGQPKQEAITTVQETASIKENSTELDNIATDNTMAVAATDEIKTVANNQTKQSAENNKQQYVNRMASFKAEQKQRMTDMFARIKALEAQQLDQYKARQEKQIARLRDQISSQQGMIEALVLRNKDLFELRAANVQRIQTNREAVLSRI